jgi:Heme exporter protein D (CcmD)
MSDSHWGFIIAAYAIAALVIGGVTLKILLDYRGLKQALGKLAGTNSRRDDIP